MSDFTWHLMDESRPEDGKNDYLVMGLRGELYLASGYEHTGSEPSYYACFYIVNHKRLWAENVLAWVEIPPLEVGV